MKTRDEVKERMARAVDPDAWRVTADDRFIWPKGEDLSEQTLKRKGIRRRTARAIAERALSASGLWGVYEAAQKVEEVEMLQSKHGSHTHLNESADAHADLALALHAMEAGDDQS